MFIFIKQYFEMGLYTKDDLATLHVGGLMTDTEYESLVATDK